METEEKALEQSISGDQLDRLYLEAFRLARDAFWQRSGDTITQCDQRALAVLKQHFSLKETP